MAECWSAATGRTAGACVYVGSAVAFFQTYFSLQVLQQAMSLEAASSDSEPEVAMVRALQSIGMMMYVAMPFDLKEL